ncbi:hypothetical protein [Rickettsia endosymbiont of Urophora cardui]|uniref:hypothetical protein n=1 Tax=Rickettsia endosymbiont of Urophora cardui TaxID=3066265 RepID=UPI00313C7184
MIVLILKPHLDYREKFFISCDISCIIIHTKTPFVFERIYIITYKFGYLFVKTSGRIDDATKAYLIAIGKLEEIVEPKDYLKLSKIYTNLAKIVLPSNNNKTEYFVQATGYKELAEKFGIPQKIEQDTSVDSSRPIYDPKDVLLSGDDSDYYSDSGN